MNENNQGQPGCSSETHPSIFWSQLTDIDPEARRVHKPDNLTDSQFYERLMLEADTMMHSADGDVGLSLYDQAYEVARDADLGFDRCLHAAMGPYGLGFFDLALKHFDEMTRNALKEKDIESLEILVAFLSGFGGFSREAADNLAGAITAAHPRLQLASLPH